MGEEVAAALRAQSKSLGDLAAGTGLTVGEVARRAGLPEPAISNWWSDDSWLETAGSQWVRALATVVPGVVDYVHGQDVASRARWLVDLKACGVSLEVDGQVPSVDELRQLTATGLKPDQIERATAGLTSRQRQVVQEWLQPGPGACRPASTVARDLGLSHDRVRQLSTAAILKLRWSQSEDPAERVVLAMLQSHHRPRGPGLPGRRRPHRVG